MTDNVVRLPRQAKPALDQFRPFYVSELQGVDLPAPEWVVDGVLLRGTVSLFAGPPGIGKSLLLQQLLTATALGQPWLGRETIQARSFGLMCEDPLNQLKRRQQDINAHFDRDAADLEMELSIESRDGKDSLLVEFPNNFRATPKYTALWDQMWDYVEDEGIKIVGVDTAAAVFGGNENSREQTTVFMRELQKKAVQIDGAVILSAHPSKGNVVSGSTAWLASARFGMALMRPGDFDPETGQPRDARVLRGLKANYGAGITSERLEYMDGVFVPTESEQKHGPTKRGPLSDQELADLRYRLLIGLKRVLQNGAKVPADEMDAKSMPNRARRSGSQEINRVPLNELYRAQQAMLEVGQIVRVSVKKQCLIRPADGPYYEGETPYLSIPAPKSELEP